MFYFPISNTKSNTRRHRTKSSRLPTPMPPPPPGALLAMNNNNNNTIIKSSSSSFLGGRRGVSFFVFCSFVCFFSLHFSSSKWRSLQLELDQTHEKYSKEINELTMKVQLLSKNSQRMESLEKERDTQRTRLKEKNSEINQLKEELKKSKPTGVRRRWRRRRRRGTKSWRSKSER